MARPRDVRSNHVLVSMIVLGGLGSFFVGTSLQTAMPLFAHNLGAGSASTAYGVLLFANGAGGLSSVALCLGTLAAGIYALRDHSAAAEAQAPTPGQGYSPSQR
jgi:hypothetical protein